MSPRKGWRTSRVSFSVIFADTGFLYSWNLIWESKYLFLIFREVKQIRPTDQSPHHKARPSDGIQ